MGRQLIYAGVALIVLGLIIVAIGKTSLPLGRLPGDFVWRSRFGTVYVPLATCVLLSALGSVLLWLFNRK